MKKALIILGCLLSMHESIAQQGLEGVYVEQFYCVSASEAKDESVVGALEEGMCTYRIYLDLEPGYRFQAAYGTDKHPLLIQSSGMFYNHPDVGNAQPNLIPARTLKNNTVLLDSWLSAGAAGETFLGIPRKYDQKGELVLQHGYFTNTTSETSLSFVESDGMYFRQPPFVPTFYQMDEVIKGLTSVTRTNTIEVANGAWACMGRGAVGADSLGTNMVLIGQLTTKGDLTYALNIMVGTPSGKSIKYVYNNPQDGELKLDFLRGKAEAFVSKKAKKKNKKRN
jgi:hypothetical protein